MRISDWSSDVCSSDLTVFAQVLHHRLCARLRQLLVVVVTALRVGMSIDFNPAVRFGYQCIGHAVVAGLRLSRQLRLVDFEVAAVQHHRLSTITTGKIDALAVFPRPSRPWQRAADA